jgi:hypothetical protein
MYAHCIFCKSSLGANRALEQFPVGRRLAFDERRGRLWVVCPFCERWNLSPIEERWEAIEQCERLFRGSYRRVSTDHISLSSHPSGLSLVRIGSPARSEMAAWRYGNELLRRRWRRAGSKAWTATAVILGWPVFWATVAYHAYQKRRTVTTVSGPAGETVRLAGRHAETMRLLPREGAWLLQVGPARRPVAMLEGDEAIWTAGQLLPWINAGGSNADGIERAVRYIEKAGSPEELFSRAAVRVQARVGALVAGEGLIRRAPLELRLALEMAAHEDLELEAARGELKRLEAAWKDAEELGRIADNLLIPESVRRSFDALLRRS